MKRNELWTIVALLGVLALWVLTVIFGGHWLNNQTWFGVSSNIIQHFSGPPLFLGLGAGFSMYWTRRCAVSYCLRRGEHPVDGTLKKVCTHHHHTSFHELIHKLHSEEHKLAGKLGWGESHKLEKDK